MEDRELEALLTDLESDRGRARTESAKDGDMIAQSYLCIRK